MGFADRQDARQMVDACTAIWNWAVAPPGIVI